MKREKGGTGSRCCSLLSHTIRLLTPSYVLDLLLLDMGRHIATTVVSVSLLSELMAIRNPGRNPLLAGCPVPLLSSGGSCQHLCPTPHSHNPLQFTSDIRLYTVSQSTARPLGQLSPSFTTYL